jgi:hypothetical protein
MTSPDNIGTRAFEVLKNIPHSTDQEFFADYMSIDDLHQLAKDSITDTGSQEILLSRTEAEYRKQVMEDLTAIKRKAKKLGIELDNITYQNFESKLKSKDGVSGVDGKLFFGFDGKAYQLKVKAVRYKKRYEFSTMNDLEISKPQSP